jgi:hypothetical protein
VKNHDFTTKNHIFSNFRGGTRRVPICSIFSNSGHVGWCTASQDTILKPDTLVMIQTKFCLKFTTYDDDRRQVMAIAHTYGKIAGFG